MSNMVEAYYFGKLHGSCILSRKHFRVCISVNHSPRDPSQKSGRILLVKIHYVVSFPTVQFTEGDCFQVTGF